MFLTWLDSNSWLIELANKRILLDPWLVGPLVFGNLPWLFKGERSQDRAIPDSIDLILLSQGLEDHAHPETLQCLDHSIPVVASPNAASVVKDLGYTSITTLDHNQTHTLGSELEITALPGAPIGPMLLENAYVLTDRLQGTTLYYEPHGYPSNQIKAKAVDVVITPLMTLSIPILGPILQGGDTAIELAKAVKPQVMIPSAAPGSVQYDGILANVLQATGSSEQIQTQLQQAGLKTKVINPEPGQRFEVELEQKIVV